MNFIVMLLVDMPKELFGIHTEEFQNGLVVFENLPIDTDTTNTFYSEYY